MTPKELNQKLVASGVRNICQMLLPNGTEDGDRWVIGSVAGDEGKSMNVQLTGVKAGCWYDFAGSQNEQGDLLELWKQSRSLSIVEAIKEVKAHLGIKDSNPFAKTHPKKTYSRPERPVARSLSSDSPHMDWLTVERCLTTKSIKAYKIIMKGDSIIFPYYRGDELIMYKTRKVRSKEMFASKDSEPCLFGWQAIPDDARTVVITEGCIDAMSYYEAGVPALSVPYGGGDGNKQRWIEYEWENLERFDEIYLSMDDDEQGKKALKEISNRLGKYRCLKISLPDGCKDANEALIGGHDLKRSHLAALPISPEELENSSEFYGKVKDLFYPPPNTDFGMALPWKPISHLLLFRTGEITIWTGINGHGKAIDTKTLIPTPDGWTSMGDMKVGDTVFDEKGVQCKVIAATEIMKNRSCYEIEFSDGTKIICDADHEWLTNTVKSRRSHRTAIRNDRVKPRELVKRGNDQTHKRTFPQVVTTKEISKTLSAKYGVRNIKNHSVDVCDSLWCHPKALPIPPYLLGLWLGDGDSYSGGFTTPDIELLDAFRSRGYKVTKRSGKYHYGITKGFQRLLRVNNFIKNKHIPDVYLRGSVNQRIALLQGLMDSDGHITEYGRCEFSTIRYEIAEKVLELVLSLGLQAKLITSRAYCNGKDCGDAYRVTFTPDFPVFRLKRKLVRNKNKISYRVTQRFIVACKKVKSIPVKCIQVDSPSNLYLATKSFIPTHNSLLLGQVLLTGVLQGYKSCIASMEMKPERTLHRIYRQASGTDLPTEMILESIRDLLHDSVYIFNVNTSAKRSKILECFRFAAQRFGVSQFVVDSLAKCGIGVKDHDAQKEFVEVLCDFAKQFDVHVHLVAHSRKGEDEKGKPGKMDVSGHGSITDLADNFVSIWRNKEREEAVAYATNTGTDLDAKWEKQADVQFRCSKQRNGEWEGNYRLGFHAKSWQFIPMGDTKPITYIKSTGEL